MQSNNRWRGAALGVAGGLVGLLAMRVYQQHLAPALSDAVSDNSRQQEEQQEQPLDSIAVVGEHHKEDESSTAALGRILYQSLTGEEPQSDELKTTLSYLVHWGFGTLQGGVYGALREDAEFPDLAGGVAFGAALWLFNDELLVPLLGLQDGPTAAPPVQHVNRLGAHLAYGSVTAATTQLLLEVARANR